MGRMRFSKKSVCSGDGWEKACETNPSVERATNVVRRKSRIGHNNPRLANRIQPVDHNPERVWERVSIVLSLDFIDEQKIRGGARVRATSWRPRQQQVELWLRVGLGLVWFAKRTQRTLFSHYRPFVRGRPVRTRPAGGAFVLSAVRPWI